MTTVGPYSGNTGRKSFHSRPDSKSSASEQSTCKQPPSFKEINESSNISQATPPSVDESQPLFPHSPKVEEDNLLQKTAKQQLIVVAPKLRKALAKNDAKQFVFLLCTIENLNTLSFDEIIGSMNFKVKEEREKLISNLFEALFISENDDLSPALDLILDSRKSAEEQQRITLVITFLCNVLSVDKNNFEIKQKKLIQEKIKLVINYRDTYYSYDKFKHKLTPRFNKDNLSSLIAVINAQEKSLKQVYKSIKGVKSLDQKELFNSMGTLGLAISANFTADIGPFTDAVVSHHAGTPNSVAQDEKGLLYNSACSLASAFLSTLWESCGRCPKKSIKNLSKIITQSLNKSVSMYKQIKFGAMVDVKADAKFNEKIDVKINLEDDAINSAAFSARLKKYNAKMHNPFLFKLKKIFKLNLFPRSPSRFIFNSYALDKKPVKHVLQQIRSEQNRFHSSLHFDKVSQLKSTILRFEQARNISSFLEELSTYKFLKDEKFIHDTVFKLKYKGQNFRGNIIQQLTNIYRRSPHISLGQKKEFREFIQKLNKTKITSLKKVLDKNKKIIIQTDWQNRVKSCLSAHQVSLNILNSDFSTVDKKFIFKCLIENLKDTEDGPMTGLCKRRNETAFEFGVAAVGYQSLIVNRYLPLLSHAGFPNSDAAKAAFGELGWFLYACLSTLGTLLVNAKTTTWKSILSSFEGSLQLLEDEESHSISVGIPEQTNRTDVSMESSTEEILSILNDKNNQGKFKPETTKRLFGILRKLTAQQRDNFTAVKFILEHKHGLKKPLLFEILKRLPDKGIDKKNLLKMYFTKEDFINCHKRDKENRGQNNFDKFNQFLTSGIKQTKFSKNQTAFFILQAKSYLLHLRSELIENQADDSEKLALYEACKKRLADVVTNSRNDQYSEFQALRKRSLSSAFWIKSFMKSVGFLAWAFVSFMASSAAAAGIMGLCIGASIALPGVGLAASIAILAAFGIFRTLTSAVSSDHPYMSHTNTSTFEFIKKELDIPEEVHHKIVRDSIEKMNTDLREYLTSTNDNLQEIHTQISKKIKEQVIGVLGHNLDQEKINLIQQKNSQTEKIKLFQKIKEDILAQSVDKETILSSLLRVVFIINESNLGSSEKLREFEILFKDIFEGKGAFAKLRLEQDYHRQKNWFVSQFILGGLYGLTPLSTLLHQADWAQVLMGAAGDLGPTIANGVTLFSSPQGNTESFQQSILLLKNVITSLLVSTAHKEKTAQEIKEETAFEGLLNQKTSRIRTSSSETKSIKIFKNLKDRTLVVV